MDDEQQPVHDKEQDEPAPKRSMRDRLFKGAHPESSPDDAAEDVPGADAEADQRAIEDEFWNKK
jgi:hypothetical protein